MTIVWQRRHAKNRNWYNVKINRKILLCQRVCQQPEWQQCLVSMMLGNDVDDHWIVYVWQRIFSVALQLDRIEALKKKKKKKKRSIGSDQHFTYESFSSNETFFAIAFTTDWFLLQCRCSLFLLLNATSCFLGFISFQFLLFSFPFANTMQSSSMKHSTTRKSHQTTVVQWSIRMRIDHLFTGRIRLFRSSTGWGSWFFLCLLRCRRRLGTGRCSFIRWSRHDQDWFLEKKDNLWKYLSIWWTNIHWTQRFQSIEIEWKRAEIETSKLVDVDAFKWNTTKVK